MDMLLRVAGAFHVQTKLKSPALMEFEKVQANSKPKRRRITCNPYGQYINDPGFMKRIAEDSAARQLKINKKEQLKRKEKELKDRFKAERKAETAKINAAKKAEAARKKAEERQKKADEKAKRLAEAAAEKQNKKRAEQNKKKKAKKKRQHKQTPQTKSRRPKKQRKSKVQYEYCSCREDIGGTMAECVECQNWYHFECLGYGPKTRLPTLWKCQGCKNSSSR
jgi:colicin import membrane protein